MIVSFCMSLYISCVLRIFILCVYVFVYVIQGIVTVQRAGEFPQQPITANAPPVFCPFQWRTSNMSESCDL